MSAYLDKVGVKYLLSKFKQIFGLNKELNTAMDYRRQYLLNIDYEKELQFNTDWIVGQGAGSYVGEAIVGITHLM